LVRAIAETAYRRGARFVDIDFDDPHRHRLRVHHARVDTLS
jgi:hypothetical protein